MKSFYLYVDEGEGIRPASVEEIAYFVRMSQAFAVLQCAPAPALIDAIGTGDSHGDGETQP